MERDGRRGAWERSAAGRSDFCYADLGAIALLVDLENDRRVRNSNGLTVASGKKKMPVGSPKCHA